MNDLNVKLNFRSRIPLFDQLREELRRFIEGGQINIGDQLPTVRDLADQLAVNFNTVARAYRSLDRLGYITSRQGRGTYVISKNGFPVEFDEQKTYEDKVDEIFQNLLVQLAHSSVSLDDLRNRIESHQQQFNKQAKLPLKIQRISTVAHRRTHSLIRANQSPRLKRKTKRNLRRVWRNFELSKDQEDLHVSRETSSDNGFEKHAEKSDSNEKMQ